MIDLWTNRPGRWRGRALPREPSFMDWRVGVLRAGAENVEWTHKGSEPDWSASRAAVIGLVREIAEREGRQEYRVQVGDVDGIIWPGIDGYGSIDVEGLGESLPLYRPC